MRSNRISVASNEAELRRLAIRSDRGRLKTSAHLIQRFHEASTTGGGGSFRPGCLKHLLQIRPPQVRHAQEPKPGLRVVVQGVDGNNVRMLKSGEHLGLIPLGARDFERDETMAQLELLRQKDDRKRSSPQLGHQVEPADDLSRLRRREPRARN
ncbi:MAG: hypothetical protein NVSMB9_18520 [Isosphaeraceae bacterium]